jgi:hypothetical protein
MKRKLTKSPADLIEEIVNLKHLLKEGERLRDIDIKAKADYWEQANILREALGNIMATLEIHDDCDTRCNCDTCRSYRIARDALLRAGEGEEPRVNRLKRDGVARMSAEERRKWLDEYEPAPKPEERKIEFEGDEYSAKRELYSAGWCDGYKAGGVESDWIDEGFTAYLKMQGIVAVVPAPKPEVRYEAPGMVNASISEPTMPKPVTRESHTCPTCGWTMHDGECAAIGECVGCREWVPRGSDAPEA